MQALARLECGGEPSEGALSAENGEGDERALREDLAGRLGHAEGVADEERPAEHPGVGAADESRGRVDPTGEEGRPARRVSKHELGDLCGGRSGSLASHALDRAEGAFERLLHSAREAVSVPDQECLADTEVSKQPGRARTDGGRVRRHEDEGRAVGGRCAGSGQEVR